MSDAPTLEVLLATALGIGVFHTLIGVDHTLPFVVIGRARGWSLRKVLGITALCGIGHVLSSVVLGAVGIGVGVAIERLEWIEGTRGTVAAWLLIGFGLLYAARALYRLSRGREHAHVHVHDDGVVHSHRHSHSRPDHLHVHGADPGRATAWALFVVFLLGPCEPLIPLLMAPAALHNPLWVALVVGVFALATLGVMLTVVAVAHLGLGRARLGNVERYADVLAGAAIASSGVAIQAFGL